jgi:geranylgeranyl diphosphate synthase type I
VIPDLPGYLLAMEQELRAVIAPPQGDLTPFYNMLAYHLGWINERFQPAQADSGKRIRPLLCLLACQAAGGDWHAALPAAAALELVHNFSLIHDDIEDNSPTRRGRPTVWTLWGLPQGINAGDGMLALAHRALLRCQEMDPALVLEAMDILDQTVLSLCHGQFLDIASEGKLDLTEEAYLTVIGGKTASLLAASPQLGALLAGAGAQAEHYRQFGWNLGLAFQMVDDILGIWGDPAVTGKPAADDISGHKMTLPVIYCLRSTPLGEELAALYRQENLSEGDVALILRILERAGAREYARGRAARSESGALAALDAARPQEPAAGALRELARSLTARVK